MRSRLFVAAFTAVALLTACGGGGTDPGPDAESPHAARADGAELLFRGGGRASAQNPAFSPDGASVVFTLFREGYNEGAAALRVLPLGARGTARAKPTTLLDEADRAAVNLPGSSWSPSGEVAFASDRAGRDEVWVLRPGGEPARVTAHEGASGYLEPSFSPDGAWIVFQESVEREGSGDHAGSGSLWKVRRDGTGAVRLLDGPATRSDNRQPNWSPKGDKLVFQRREGDGDWALYTVNADGSGLRRLTRGRGEHTDPSWSPDGRWVVFSSTEGGLDLPQIFVTPADGGGRPVRVTRDDGRYDGAPSWSPDGRWIAFESHAGDEDRPSSLWRIPAPGTG
ncbi:hypothetical protein BLA24_11740 [Streptomyces cinnamoneus]|uniref:TolB protein n=1 Tax=Streptomyces cinnamoneus TaxID=53446 RepID=A0A2G1XKJ3_STRCJ|nr:TolB family protein [Streptomyces cinnamoneus]PHQ51752.1 hypothetical protein BLA24_11740 [Streptomyces cinnamoneus]PPT12000.1 hypothetical protein CYQ11_02980 [Streptomyces cinnamoneus]